MPTENALLQFACTHKNIKNGGTGAGRKAAQIQAAATRNTAQNEDDEATSNPSKRQKARDGEASTASAANRSLRVSPAPGLGCEDEDGYVIQRPTGVKPNLIATKRSCFSCDTDVSPKWHPDRVLHHAWAKSSNKKFFGIGPPKGRPTSNAMPLAGPSESESISSHGQVNNRISEPDDLVMGQSKSRETTEPGNSVDSKSMAFDSRSISQIDGIMDLDGTEIVNGEKAVAVQDFGDTSATALNGLANGLEQIPDGTLTRPLQYLCHKCYIRKQKNPASPRDATPPSQLVESDIQEVKPSSPPVSLVLSQPSAPQAQEKHRTWHSPVEYISNGSERALNGIVRSPTLAASPPTQHYTAPPEQHYAAAPYAYPPHSANGHERSSSYRPNPGVHYMPPPVNGHPPPSEPPSFVYRRNPDTGQMMTVPYIPPGQRGAHPPQARPNPSLVRSPPVRHTQSPSVHMRSPPLQEQGPHGPPEADSNPFALPTGPSHHTSPQPQYASNNIYGSRRGSRDSRERPRTPTVPFNERGDGRWPSEIVNGASASPSVRNLLH